MVALAAGNRASHMKKLRKLLDRILRNLAIPTFA